MWTACLCSTVKEIAASGILLPLLSLYSWSDFQGKALIGLAEVCPLPGETEWNSMMNSIPCNERHGPHRRIDAVPRKAGDRARSRNSRLPAGTSWILMITVPLLLSFFTPGGFFSYSVLLWISLSVSPFSR